MDALLADVVLFIHFAFVLFVVGGFALILAGAAFGWRWVRNRAFRYLHLAAIVFVAAEALLGTACPLTIWEDLLRGGVRPESFVGRWVYRLLYYDAPEWVFTALYCAWATASLLTLKMVPPKTR